MTTALLTALLTFPGLAAGGPSAPPPALPLPWTSPRPTQPGPPQVEGAPEERAEEDDAPGVEVFDEKLVLGGRLYTDLVYASADEGYALGAEDGLDFRRLRLIATGELDGGIRHRVEVDFSDDEVEVLDAFVSFDLGPGSLRVGRFWEPFGLEQNTDASALTFLERAPTFAPARNDGVAYSGASESGDATWSVGVFRENDDDSPDEDRWNVTARGTLLPIDGPAGLLHVGLALSQQARPRVYEARSNNPLAGALVSPPFGEDETRGPLLVGVEAAGVWGGWSAQAELQLASADEGNPVAGYLYASRFLTEGDRRSYDRRRGTFGPVTPASPRGAGGGGAWEVALRLDAIDFSEVRGGLMTGATLGVNWYLTSRARLMLDYSDSSVDANDDGDSQSAETLGLRLQLDF